MSENDHNPYFLRDKLKWQQRNFDRALEQLHSVTENMTRDIHYATVDRAIEYSSDSLREYTHADAAAQTVASISQALPNYDLRGLVQTAADLSITHSVLRALEPLGAADAELEERWLTEYNEWRNTKTGEVAARQAKYDVQCQCNVPEGGRGVGFRRCSKKSVETITLESGDTLRRCGTCRKQDKRTKYRSGHISISTKPRP